MSKEYTILIVAGVISILTMVVSIVFAIITHRTAKKTEEIQNRIR